MRFAREIGDLLLTGTGWWRHAASYCIGDGHYEAIPSRDGKSLYLLRCWLTKPSPAGDGRWESGDSVLLHAFARPDDDGALHDHPWGFTTDILQGGYIEHLGDHSAHRIVGDRVRHDANDRHMVYSLDAPTWTMVRTGKRERDWGFHIDGAFVPWQTHLKEKFSHE